MATSEVPTGKLATTIERVARGGVKTPAGSLSAKELDERAREAFVAGNRGRLELCEVLRVLSETRLYCELGYPSLAAYAEDAFQIGRAEAFECVRVAGSVLELTDLRETFLRGRMGWSVLKAVTRVAASGTQRKWITFARERGVEAVLAEVRDARRQGRDAPREGSYGLPNLDQRLVLRFTRSEMERVRQWLDGVADEVRESTGKEDLSFEQLVLYVCERDAQEALKRTDAAAREQSANADSVKGGSRPTERDAESANADSGADGRARPRRRGKSANADSGRHKLVYHRCPDCKRGRMSTREGFVEVDAAEIERVAGDAQVVTIDKPTPPALRRKIKAREGDRCGNPRCHHRADHCHHIEFRSEGGKTVLENEVALCATCHALVHAKLLKIYKKADDLIFEPHR